MVVAIEQALKRATKDFQLSTADYGELKNQLHYAKEFIKFEAIWKFNILCNDVSNGRLYIPICRLTDGVALNTELLSSKNPYYLSITEDLKDVGINIHEELPHWASKVLTNIEAKISYNWISKANKQNRDSYELNFAISPTETIRETDSDLIIYPNYINYTQQKLIESFSGRKLDIKQEHQFEYKRDNSSKINEQDIGPQYGQI